MKRLLFVALLCTLALPVAAQDESPEGDPPLIALGARQMVIEFLELDEVQVEEWEILWFEHRDAEIPIREQIAEVQALIEEQFATGAPDPTELGRLMIDRRSLGEALAEVHVIYVEGFQMLLDEEQERRLHQLRVADRIQGFIPAFKAFELVRR